MNASLPVRAAGLLLAAFAASVAAAPREEEPVFIAGSQYSAVLSQDAQRWRLLPLDGPDVEIRTPADGCEESARLARGVWLVTRDANGALELTAPSTTHLAAGEPGRVRVIECGTRSGDDPAIHAPKVLIDWLAARTGAVYADG